MIKKCEWCGNEFSTSQKGQRFCSLICAGENRTNYTMETRKCIYCDNEFTVKKSSNKQYCSTKCSGDSRKGKPKSISDINKVNSCVECGVEFKPTYDKQKFCSQKCSGIHRTNESYEERECLICGTKFKAKKFSLKQCCSTKCGGIYHKNTGSLLKHIKAQTTKSCLNCGKEFTIWNYRKDSALFCSKKCSDNHKNISSICIECGIEYNIPNWEKDAPINAVCSKCRKTSDRKRPLRKSSFELNVISLLKQKLIDVEIIDYSKIRINNIIIFPDIIIGNNIIECQGDYWHCKPSKFEADYYHSRKHLTAQQIWDYDRNKEEALIKEGYNVLYIWEEDFYKNKEESINKLINELKWEQQNL